MPKNRALARFRFDIAKSRPRQPCTVEEPLQYRGHPHPPHRIHDDKVVGPLHELLKTFEIGFKLLHGAVPTVQNGVKMNITEVHSLDGVTARVRTLFVRISEVAAYAALIAVP